MVCAEGVKVTFGTGCMVIVKVFGEPEQPSAVGVTIYFTTAGVVPVLLKISFRVLPELGPNPVAVPENNDAVHENEVPPTLLVNGMATGPPEQMVFDSWVLETSPFGLTVITTGTDDPVQLSAVGVML
jgi:hypothetical protein